jgi:hypothetical protein
MDGSQSPARLLSLRPDVVATVLENEAVLLDLETKYFYSVNATGWAIVQLFETGASVERARERCREWGASPGDDDAIARFLDALVADRLVIECAEATGADGVKPNGAWTAPAIEKHKEPLQRIMVSAFDPTLPLAE